MLYVTIALFALAVGLFALHLFWAKARGWVWKAVAVLGGAMLPAGAYFGLSWAPSEQDMGEVYRIIFVHVPMVWAALLALVVNFVASAAYLFKRSWTSDSLGEAGAEVGVVFGVVGLLLGSIWGRPTWGVWWDWDPRLTTTAIMLVLYTGYLALRKFVDDPEKRATWSAVVGVIAAVDLPIVWFSVRWWKSIHQVQSNPKTIDRSMFVVLVFNVVAFMCALFVYLWHRFLIAKAARAREVALPSALPPAGPQEAA
ncbi:MAG: cytochrome c biogenesis protein CcsA [Myxococcales bacterium]|nr:cytochrome c biogenesis protein CcsA [Myxococcales bacterium]